MKHQIFDTFVNDDPGLGLVRPGEICAANEGRFDSTYFDEPLTNYATGIVDRDPLQELLDFYAPACNVPRRFKYRTFDFAGEMLRDEGGEDIRAIGADFAKVPHDLRGEANGETQNKGLTVSVDIDELNGDPNVEERRVQRVIKRLLRNDLRRALAMLDAAAVSTDEEWGSSSDPDQAVRDALLAVENTYGVRPNRVGYGSAAWSLRTAAYRQQNNAGGYASSAMSPQQLAAWLMTENMAWGEAHYRDGNGALATYFGARLLMFQAFAGMDPMDDSNIKRFVSNVGGFKVYRQQIGPKKIEITVEHYSSIILTRSTGIRRFMVSAPAPVEE